MTQRWPSIIVGCDGSKDSERALSWATSYARASEGSLHLVSAWEWPTVLSAPVVLGDYDPRKASRELLDRLVEGVDLPPERIDRRVAKGQPARVLVDLSTDADLLVVGSHGQGPFSRLVLGSVSGGCVAHASCPVVIVREVESSPSAGIVVGLDDSESARLALRWAMNYADLTHQPLTVIRCAEPQAPMMPAGYPVSIQYDPGAVQAALASWLRDTVAKEESERGRPVVAGTRTLVLDGPAANALVERSQDAAMVVVGRRGAGGFTRLMLGSVSSALAHHGHSTVVVTPSK